MTPTARSLTYLRQQGWLADTVERWIPQTRTRKDLFGMWDLLAVRGDITLAVQVTSGSNVAARVRKIAEHENIAVVREAGWVLHVHGWRKNAKGRWELREVDVS